MKKILALGFLGFAYAADCSNDVDRAQSGRTDCYEDSQEYKVATNKTITNLVLTEITSEDAVSRGYTAADVGKYGISNCDNESTDHKKWGDEVNGNVVECASVYEKANGDSNLAPGLVREPKTDGDGGTYHRILLQTNAMCNSLTTSSTPSLADVCTGDSFTGTLIADATTTECASDPCATGDPDKSACCLECTGDSYVDEDSSTCKTGIVETGEISKFKQLSVLRGARSGNIAAQSRLNAFFKKLQKQYQENARSDFSLFSPTDFKDTRDSLVAGQNIQILRAGNIKRRTFGRIKMTKSEAIAAKIAITKDGDDLEELEFDMEHEVGVEGADDVADFQSFGFGGFDITCQTTSTTTATCGHDDGQRRRLDGIESCFQGAAATWDADLEVWTFDPGTIEFSQTCAVSESNGQYTISHCVDFDDAGTGYVQSYSRDTEWATYSAPLVCSLCPSGSGVESGTEGSSAQCEVCSANDEFNSKLDNSECDSCPTFNTDTLISDGDHDLCLCKPGFFGAGVTHQADNCAPCGADSYSSVSGASSCTPFDDCVAGQKIDDSGSASTPRTCTQCVSGTYSTTANANSCTICSGASGPGVGDGWSALEGASSCESFITCDAGQKIDDSGSTSSPRTCTQCVSGTYSTTENANSCTICDANSVDCAGSSEGKCNAGYSGDGASCAQCAIGKFKGDVANGGCTNCTDPSPGVVGGYTSEVGQTACKSCSLFSTEWINTQCCSDSTHCGHLLNQCGTSC